MIAASRVVGADGRLEESTFASESCERQNAGFYMLPTWAPLSKAGRSFRDGVPACSALSYLMIVMMDSDEGSAPLPLIHGLSSIRKGHC